MAKRIKISEGSSITPSSVQDIEILDEIKTTITETISIVQSGTYKVIRRISADIANRIIIANPDDIINLNDFEAKMLQHYIEEV